MLSISYQAGSGLPPTYRSAGLELEHFLELLAESTGN
jgi:hypothetical protein